MPTWACTAAAEVSASCCRRASSPASKSRRQSEQACATSSCTAGEQEGSDSRLIEYTTKKPSPAQHAHSAGLTCSTLSCHTLQPQPRVQVRFQRACSTGPTYPPTHSPTHSETHPPTLRVQRLVLAPELRQPGAQLRLQAAEGRLVLPPLAPALLVALLEAELQVLDVALQPREGRVGQNERIGCMACWEDDGHCRAG